MSCLHAVLTLKWSVFWLSGCVSAASLNDKESRHEYLSYGQAKAEEKEPGMRLNALVIGLQHNFASDLHLTSV